MNRMKGRTDPRTTPVDVPLATGSPRRTASRAPARAANSTATQVGIWRSNGVTRACGLVSPPACSTNVTAAHTVFTHLKRRTVRRSTVLIPSSSASASRRTFRPCTRSETWSRCVHVPSTSRARACSVIASTARQPQRRSRQMREKILNTPRIRSTIRLPSVRTHVGVPEDRRQSAFSCTSLCTFRGCADRRSHRCLTVPSSNPPRPDCSDTLT